VTTLAPTHSAPAPHPTLRADVPHSAPHSASRLTAQVGARRPTLLLIEPDYLMRRAVALTARDLGIGEIHETNGYEAAARLLDRTRFDGLLVDLGEPGRSEPALALIERVRLGTTHCASGAPIAVMAENLDAGCVAILREFKVARILVKPAKVKTLLEALMAIAAPQG